MLSLPCKGEVSTAAVPAAMERISSASTLVYEDELDDGRSGQVDLQVRTIRLRQRLDQSSANGLARWKQLKGCS